MKITLGPAGSPASSSLEGLRAVKDMGLGAMELSFTHGVRMSTSTAMTLGEANKQTKLRLSVHAPYYLNLCSAEMAKRTATMQRILDTCERAHHIGAEKVVFHPAYYGTMAKHEVYEIVAHAVNDIHAIIRQQKWNVGVFPETTGRTGQFGTLDELIRLRDETGCSFCVDVAHLYARGQGVLDYATLLDTLESTRMKEWHFHFQCVAFGTSGEKNHLPLSAKQPDFEPFARELLARRRDAVIISESPITWQDSLVMKRILESLGYRF